MIALLGNNSFSNENESLHLKDILRPHLSKLLPRILRARHDPNQQTRDQMESIWNGLTGVVLMHAWLSQSISFPRLIAFCWIPQASSGECDLDHVRPWLK